MKNPSTQDNKNAALGLKLFALYTVFYASFVLVNAFAASWSEWVPFGGLNLAVLWGFALILLAFVLALVYGLMCPNEIQPVSIEKQATAEEGDAT